jgi:riboflavin transporter FmnP
MTDDRSEIALKRVPFAYRIARIAVLSSLSVVGSFMHLPGPIPSVAFDSWPGFFAALYFGAFDGALVSGIGHVATSIINGFPLGILHFPIALGLAFAGWAIGVVNRLNRSWGLVAALIVGVAINTGLVIVAVPALGWAATISFAPFLLFAACVNALVAGLAYSALRGRLRL